MDAVLELKDLERLTIIEPVLESEPAEVRVQEPTRRPGLLEPLSFADLDYVAVCIAAEMVRIRISASHYQRGRDISPLIMQPLVAVANALGLLERVNELMAEALPGTEPLVSTPAA